MEMRERTPGTIRPKKTALPPCRTNQAIAVSMSLCLVSGIRSASCRSRRSPSAWPSQYSSQAPVTDPTVVQTTADRKLKWPSAAAKPASGRITSLGMGGKTFSRKTASAAPGAPITSIRRSSQSITVPTTSVDSSGRLVGAVASEFTVHPSLESSLTLQGYENRRTGARRTQQAPSPSVMKTLGVVPGPPPASSPHRSGRACSRRS